MVADASTGKVPAGVRFLGRYEIDEGGCWLWTGSKDSDGYGTFQLTTRTTIRAHRFAFEVLKGPIPPGLLVCHTCDVPSCVNPDHLFLGTNADNMRDMVLKGRARTMINPNPGERNGRAKLREHEVIYIRTMHANLGTKVLSEKFGVSYSAIQSIVNRVNWPHLP